MAYHGNVDVSYSRAAVQTGEFSKSACAALTQKGWCLIQMNDKADVLREAVDQAKLLDYTVPRKEFVTDYMGQDSSGKLALLERDYIIEGGLANLDIELDIIADQLDPYSREHLASNVAEKKSMIWMSMDGKNETNLMKPEALTQEDVEDGLIRKHIEFLRNRKLCMMFFVDGEADGEIHLLPLDKDQEPVPLSAASNRLLVFCPGRFGFSFRPKGAFVMLQSWLLDVPPPLELGVIKGSDEQISEIMGVKNGFPVPMGDRSHIMSMMCRYPGNGFGEDGYWIMLLSSTEPFTTIPTSRWDMEVYCTADPWERIEGKCYARHGGFCKESEIYNFDGDFFGLTDVESARMTPHARVVMEDGYTTLFKSGLRKDDLEGRDIGVFIGDTGCDWNQDVGFAPQALGKENMDLLWPGMNTAITANRLSHTFGMVGPTGSCDTACSSSLVALGCAMQLLRPRSAGLSDHASSRIRECLIDGVCCQVGPWSYIGMCALSMISSRGRCFTFDESGDGYARGEGNGAIFIKANTEQKDIREQLACLMSSQINQDGRSASMTAPNGPSQQACIKLSMIEAGCHPSQINLAECHGTGTALGDPIEVGAIRNTMDPRDTVICLASAKCFIGHLEGGAGMGGVCKCVGMLMAGQANANNHCRQLNPNLSVVGFPVLFETESVEYGLNSALTGVSSFGFGGTNGRSDLWGMCVKGNNKCQTDKNYPQFVQVTCPITMGPIDNITGEPVPEFALEGQEFDAGVLRDESAPYDISTDAYDGGFRFRMGPTEEDEKEDEDLPEGASLFVCGSWSGYQMEPMEKDEDGWYYTSMVLGETRCELFDLCFNASRINTIHPAIDNAHQKIWISGPNDTGKGQKWIIDGRDTGVCEGTSYVIRFKWGWNKKRIFWTEIKEGSEYLALAAKPSYKHTYSVVGSWTGWKPLELRSSTDGVWEGTFRIGYEGHEEFKFVRDGDMSQAIYPSRSTGKMGALVRGPDSLAGDRHWILKGGRNDAFSLRLQVVDAKVSVTLKSATTGDEKVWASAEGWARHEYCVAGTFNLWKPEPMTMDESTPGVFRLRASISRAGKIPLGVGVLFREESFRVLVDGCEHAAMYPEATEYRSGSLIVSGPDANANGRQWSVRSDVAGRAFEIVLDLTTKDRRKIVTWSWLG